MAMCWVKASWVKLKIFLQSPLQKKKKKRKKLFLVYRAVTILWLLIVHYVLHRAFLPALIHLIFKLTLYYPHFTDEKQRHRESYIASTEWRWILHNIFLLLKFVFMNSRFHKPHISEAHHNSHFPIAWWKS